MNDDTKLYELSQMIRAIERLNANCERNMKTLNAMMLELKGLIAMVRPAARKNDWYGEEISANGVDKAESIQGQLAFKRIDDDAKNLIFDDKI
jgi:hypothetical protein